MFSRRERLPRSQFPAVLASGKRLSSPHFSAVASKEARGYAVVIPKKVARLSVTRHRLKRQVLEALRGMPLPPALILFPRPSASSVSYEDMKRELAGLLSTIKP